MEQQGEATQDTIPQDLTKKEIRSIWPMPRWIIDAASQDGTLVHVGRTQTGKRGKPANLFSRASAEALAAAYESAKAQRKSG